MKKIVWLALFLVYMSHFAEAQGWVRTYTVSGGNFKSLTTVAAKNDSFVTAGYFTPTGTFSGYLFIQKCTSTGIPVWQKSFPTISVRNFQDTMTVNRANDGGYLIAITSGYSNPNQVRVIKIDELGNLIWQKNYTVRGYIAYCTILPNKAKTGYGILGLGSYLRIANNGNNISSDSISANYEYGNWATSSKTDNDFVGIKTSFPKKELFELQSDNSFTIPNTPISLPDSIGSNIKQLSDGNYWVILLNV